MTRIPEGQRFSDPGNDAMIMAAWERFLDGTRRPTDSLRSLVDGSWQRCQQHNVDPDKRSAPPPVEASTLAAMKQNHSELLEVSAPIMANARDFLAETGTVMALADTSCTILTMEGDDPTLGVAENIHLLPGAAWSERLCGTNAIGTALAVGEPVQIHSAEHYCAGIKRWTCSATVIRHPHDGEIIGVVDVSGLSESYSRQSLALVVTTASRIESKVAMREMERRYQLLDASLPRWSGGTDGLVLFDRRGFPVKANEIAQAAMSALGADLDLAAPRRIPSLAVGERGEPMQDSGLPAWVRKEWLEPVIGKNGARLGTLLVLPLPRLGCTVAGESARALSREPGKAQDMPAGFSTVITRDPGLRDAVRKADQLARSKVPVLLLGETGAGKEEFAQGLHRASPFRDGPYVALNCGGLSRELLASELFGYVDGAFTGARRGGLVGKIEAANGGTLFLDEIGEMPLDLQPHLLRVLEQSEIYRLGENVPRKVNFRLVAATNRDLRKEVADGRFRMDFYYRVAVTSIRIPPLRDRKGDVRALAEHFVERFSKQHELGPRRLDDDVITRLDAYAWPGNVRELRNVIESMLLMSDDETVGLDALPPELLGAASASEPLFSAVAGTVPSGALQVNSMAEGEAELIRRAIAATHGNLTRAARELAIAKSTLYQKVKLYGLECDIFRVRAS
ncbi:MAG: sigma-54-dependent Fis family transcriptional regulator [Aromatoleum sp.]|jgi:transcriptional regulator of acetoin/glycerol metabolism|uniref:sigma-54-dependent Fis family transcriptional regulator n=1 Tax=Aromatoleum sp. TaxID=2307007 RepID=UPI00289545CC|nr:sigma-54-dependent Fis family transcriptional regulator [Aromatoleum sp.]MDT3669808.1 sigma-54-dependent Fis family transcriptional regulator [Aromatoleum sp.]